MSHYEELNEVAKNLIKEERIKAEKVKQKQRNQSMEPMGGGYSSGGICTEGGSSRDPKRGGAPGVSTLVTVDEKS